MDGRLILIKYSLQSIPMYLLAALDPPKLVLSNIEKAFANFLWDSQEGL